jgi:CRP/FNR family cyclic AMP-dependent transcriptional regulator
MTDQAGAAGTVDRERVAALGFFDGIAVDEINAVARAATVRDFAAGDSVTTERDFGHSLYFVEDGSADVSIDGERVGSVGPGDVVGERAVLTSGRRTASVIATSPLRAIALFKRDVWALERDAPEAGRRLRQALDEHAPPPR